MRKSITTADFNYSASPSAQENIKIPLEDRLIKTLSVFDRNPSVPDDFHRLLSSYVEEEQEFAIYNITKRFDSLMACESYINLLLNDLKNHERTSKTFINLAKIIVCYQELFMELSWISDELRNEINAFDFGDPQVFTPNLLKKIGEYVTKEERWDVGANLLKLTNDRIDVRVSDVLGTDKNVFRQINQEAANRLSFDKEALKEALRNRQNFAIFRKAFLSLSDLYDIKKHSSQTNLTLKLWDSFDVDISLKRNFFFVPMRLSMNNHIFSENEIGELVEYHKGLDSALRTTSRERSLEENDIHVEETRTTESFKNKYRGTLDTRNKTIVKN